MGFDSHLYHMKILNLLLNVIPYHIYECTLINSNSIPTLLLNEFYTNIFHSNNLTTLVEAPFFLLYQSNFIAILGHNLRLQIWNIRINRKARLQSKLEHHNQSSGSAEQQKSLYQGHGRERQMERFGGGKRRIKSTQPKPVCNDKA